MLTILWNMKGPITIVFLEKDTTVNSASYYQYLRQYFTFFIKCVKYHGTKIVSFIIHLLLISLFISVLILFKHNSYIFSLFLITCPVDWGCRIHRLQLCWGVRPSYSWTSALDMTQNHLIVKLHSWSFGECGVPLHCHCTQVHSDPVQ